MRANHLVDTVFLGLFERVQEVPQLVGLGCFALPHIALSHETLKLRLEVAVYVCKNVSVSMR
jgi:hypothetical protein